MDTPPNAWTRSRVPSITFTSTRSVSPGANSGMLPAAFALSICSCSSFLIVVVFIVLVLLPFPFGRRSAPTDRAVAPGSSPLPGPAARRGSARDGRRAAPPARLRPAIRRGGGGGGDHGD